MKLTGIILKAIQNINKAAGDLLFGKLVKENILDKDIQEYLDKANEFLDSNIRTAVKYFNIAHNLYNRRFKESGDNYDLNSQLNQFCFVLADKIY